jgi:predicted cobalt transporter CbtA
MVRGLLVSGMLAGCLAGILGFCFAWVAGESQVETAIAFEAYVESAAHHDAAGHHDPAGHHDEEGGTVVSRPVQGTAGLVTGTLMYGVALGGMFALVFAAVYGRLRPFAARGTAALLGCLGFIAVYLVPFLKYPANPPAVGDPDTIQFRTAVYLVMVVVSVVAMVLAVVAQQRLARTLGGWNASLLAGGAYVVVIALCYLVLPGVNEVPQQALPSVVDAVSDVDVTFPPSVLWAFRVASLGLQVVIWTTIALVFGALVERKLETSDRSARALRA